MAERPQRQGGLRIDPAVAAFQQKAAVNTAALTSKQRRDRKRVRVMYDLAPEVKGAIEKIAEEQKTSASQAAALLLTWAAVRYFGGNGAAQELKDAFLDGREPSRTPRFEFNVEPSETFLDVLRERQH